MQTLHKVARAVDDWRSYRRTVSEIRAMPQNLLRDLGIIREDAERIAREAVYGR